MSSRTPRPRAQLSPDTIIEAATQIAANSGIEGLTVRRLGQHLGADPTAIYRHFRDKDEILLAVTDRLLSGLADRLPPNLAWRVRLDWIARQSIAVFLAHPVIGAAMASRTTRREGEFRLVEAVLGALREAGLSDVDAVAYHRTFADVIVAYGGMRASFSMLEDEARQRDESAWSREYLTASPETFPNIAAVAPLMAQFDPDTVLDLVITLFLDGIERRVHQEHR
jgi:AcrR family transcriptional regulator